MLPSRGRPGLSLMMTVERELTVVDLVALSTGEIAAPVQGPPTIQKLRASHHAVAIALAAGRSVQETAYMVGYTPQRVSDLQSRDPTFQNLLAYYRNQATEVAVNDSNRIQAKLVDLGEAALDEIIGRVDDDALRAQMPLGELRQLAAMSLDRTVAPPKTTQPVTIVPTKITFNMGNRDLRPQVPEGTIEIEHEAISGDPTE